jgi:hypothetical protein
VNHTLNLLLMTLALLGGIGAALVATLLAVPALVLIALGEAFQNAYTGTPSRHA